MPEDDAARKPKASAAWAGLASERRRSSPSIHFGHNKNTAPEPRFGFRCAGGPRAVASKALSEEGVSALFRGLVPRLLTYAPVKSIALRAVRLLWRYAMGRRLAGGCNTLLSCPVDALKSRVQTRQDTMSWHVVMRQMC